MAKKINKLPQYTCGECGHGTPDTKHINISFYDHKPIVVSCPFQQYKQVVTEYACKNFKPKQ